MPIEAKARLDVFERAKLKILDMIQVGDLVNGGGIAWW